MPPLAAIIECENGHQLVWAPAAPETNEVLRNRGTQ
jgi:hypothetical protein